MPKEYTDEERQRLVALNDLGNRLRDATRAKLKAEKEYQEARRVFQIAMRNKSNKQLYYGSRGVEDV